MNAYTLYIGVELDRHGMQLSPEVRAEALSHLREKAAARFGGYTLANVEGGWKAPDGKLHVEGAVRVEIFSDRSAWEVEAFGREIAGALRQASFVLHRVPVNDHAPLTFVEVDEKAAA